MNIFKRMLRAEMEIKTLKDKVSYLDAINTERTYRENCAAERHYFEVRIANNVPFIQCTRCGAKPSALKKETPKASTLIGAIMRLQKAFGETCGEQRIASMEISKAMRDALAIECYTCQPHHRFGGTAVHPGNFAIEQVMGINITVTEDKPATKKKPS